MKQEMSRMRTAVCRFIGYFIGFAFVVQSCAPVPHLAGPVRPVPIYWSLSCDFPNPDAPVVRRAFDYWNSIVPMWVERPCGDWHSVMTVVEDDDAPGTVRLGPNGITDSIEDWDTSSTDGVIAIHRTWHGRELGTRESEIRRAIGSQLGLTTDVAETCLMYRTIHVGLHWYFDEPKQLCREERRDLVALYGARK
jgi:hypothetical protein